MVAHRKEAAPRPGMPGRCDDRGGEGSARLPTFTGCGTTRRAVLGGCALVPIALPMAALGASPDDQLATAIREATNGAAVRQGRVALTMPELAENGNSVALTVAVDSPMTAADHVRQVHILSEKNPIAGIARFKLGSRAGRARIQTNVRVATSQRIVALAEMSDGSFWSGAAEVVVTITACLDAG